jgi:DNA-binding NtrC family response regulator
MDQDLLVCIVDDDQTVRDGGEALLRSAGMRVETYASAAAFLERPPRETPACLILDVNLPGLSGIELQQELARTEVQIPIIFITGHGDIPMSVKAIKAGAHEFFTKPFEPDDLLDSIHGAIARKTPALGATARPLTDRRVVEEVVGGSVALQGVLKQVRTVAATNSTVLIQGETGTGKELIARALHNLSGQRNGPFVKVNCAAIPKDLLESELMGHEKGAFTGAFARRIGRFELAQHGTLFLDEIGELALDLQPKLLRLLQEREFERVGGTRTLHTNARLIAATNRDLGALSAAGSFRQDLYYRLNVFPLQMPPLRERREDVAELTRAFVAELSARMNKRIESISEDAIARLVAYPWPGNIRELQNVLERAVILCEGSVLEVPSLPVSPRAVTSAAPPSSMTQAMSAPASAENPADQLDAVNRTHILAVLHATGWIVAGPTGAAARLGMKRSTLNFRMKKLGIARPFSAPTASSPSITTAS